MTEKPEASVLTARRAAQHFRLSSADDACEHLYILTVRSSLGPSPPNAGRYTVASRFRCRSCERGYIFPRAPEQFVASPLCLVGYVRWDARSDRVPPLQTIIFSSFTGRTKSCRPSVRNHRNSWNDAYLLRYDCSHALFAGETGDGMGILIQDSRYGLRVLRKSPGFTVVTVLTLALGIGATTAIFTLVQQVMLRSLPVAQPEHLWRIGDAVRCCYSNGYTQGDGSFLPQNDWSLFSWQAYKLFRDSTPAFEQLARVPIS